MATFLSENLNENETVHDGPSRLVGYELANTGSDERFVAFKDGGHTHIMVVVPPQRSRSITGLFEPYPEGLSVESLTGDGTLVANVFYEPREDVVEEPGGTLP